jgi:hypothetical protein
VAISKNVYDEDVDISPIEEIPQQDDPTLPSDALKVEPLISLNALTSLFVPQTLKLIGYIKHRKFIILVDSGSAHNFIYRCNSQEVNFYVCGLNNFQVMITNGVSMKCGGCCKNVHLQIGQYHLKSHMFSIDMGDCEIVLGVE